MRLLIVTDAVPDATSASGEVLSQLIKCIPQVNSVFSFVISKDFKEQELKESNSDVIFSTQIPNEFWTGSFSKTLAAISQRYTRSFETRQIIEKVQQAIDAIEPDAVLFSIQSQSLARIANQLNTFNAKRVCLFWDHPIWWENPHGMSKTLRKLFFKDLRQLSEAENIAFVTSERAKHFLEKISGDKLSVLSDRRSEYFRQQVESVIFPLLPKEFGHVGSSASNQEVLASQRIRNANWSENGPNLSSGTDELRVPEFIFVWRRFSISQHLYRFLRMHLIVLGGVSYIFKPGNLFSKLRILADSAFSNTRKVIFVKLQKSAEQVQLRNRRKLKTGTFVPGTLSYQDQSAVSASLARNSINYIVKAGKYWVR